MTDDQIREWLREMRDEPVPADSLARVRTRVAERTAARRRGWWWVPVVAALAVGVAVLLLMVRRPVSPPKAAPAIVAVAKDAEPPLPIVQAQAVPRRPKPAVRIQSGVSIRIETADPEVVLILVTDGGGD